MFVQFRMHPLFLFMVIFVMVVASKEDETKPAWRKIDEPDPIVTPQLKGMEESGM